MIRRVGRPSRQFRELIFRCIASGVPVTTKLKYAGTRPFLVIDERLSLPVSSQSNDFLSKSCEEFHELFS